MNVTFGVPRLKKNINATPIITARLVQTDNCQGSNRRVYSRSHWRDMSYALIKLDMEVIQGLHLILFARLFWISYYQRRRIGQPQGILPAGLHFKAMVPSTPFAPISPITDDKPYPSRMFLESKLLVYHHKWDQLHHEPIRHYSELPPLLKFLVSLVSVWRRWDNGPLDRCCNSREDSIVGVSECIIIEILHKAKASTSFK